MLYGARLGVSGRLLFRGQFWMRPGRLLVMKVQAKVWLRARTGDLERNLGPGPVLMKEGVNRLQQDGFPPLCHVRELRLHSERAMKIEDLPIEAVLP